VLLTVIPVLVVVLLSMIVGRVATTALTLTGMSREQARFQSRSALTGAGFTTTESESIVNHPVRRRIVMLLMLTGSAGIVSVIGTIAVGAARSAGNERGTPELTLGLAVAGILLLLWIMRLRPVDRALSRLIRYGLTRYTDLEVRDVESLLDIHGGYSIAELLVEDADWVCERSLMDLRLNDEGILVLGIQRRNGGYDGAPKGRATVHAGDTLLLYGHQDRIAQLDDRVKGPLGDAEHERSRAEVAESLVSGDAEATDTDHDATDDGRADDPSTRSSLP
jgi:hypothetical protein